MAGARCRVSPCGVLPSLRQFIYFAHDRTDKFQPYAIPPKNEYLRRLTINVIWRLFCIVRKVRRITCNLQFACTILNSNVSNLPAFATSRHAKISRARARLCLPHVYVVRPQQLSENRKLTNVLRLLHLLR
jgi:hypothetical protein